MLLVDGVTLMELTRGPIFQHSWFTWWSGFELDFRVFGFLKFETRSWLVDEGANSQHSSDAFGRPGNSSGVYSWPDSVTFMVHMVVGILVGFGIFEIPRLESKRPACPPGGGHPHTDGCGSTVSTAFARKPWLAVYRAHSVSCTV